MVLDHLKWLEAMKERSYYKNMNFAQKESSY